MDGLSEQFVYPSNKKYRRVYIALLKYMHSNACIFIKTRDGVDIILDELGQFKDHTHDTYGPKYGNNGNKAITILKSLHPFIVAPSCEILEICVYGLNKERITNFNQFLDLCACDNHMSTIEPAHNDLIYKPWDESPTISHSSMKQLSIDRVASATISTDDKKEFGTMTNSKHSNEEIGNLISTSVSLD